VPQLVGRFGQSKPLDKEEFQRRRDDVTAVYAPLPAGEMTLCVDVKRVYHRPRKGPVGSMKKCLPIDRRGITRVIRAPISWGAGTPAGAVAPGMHAKGDRGGDRPVPGAVVGELVAAGWQRIHIVMDNASTNGAALKEAVMVPWLAYLAIHWTPPHASWLNLAEPFWSSFHRAVLQGSWLTSHDEVVAVTTAYLEYWRKHPREYRWPKAQRQRRRPAALPLWKRLDAIPINS